MDSICSECGSDKNDCIKSLSELTPFFIPALVSNIGSISYRKLVTIFSFKRQAINYNCETCSCLKFQCPYCNEKISTDEAKQEICPVCKKKFYLYL